MNTGEALDLMRKEVRRLGDSLEGPGGPGDLPEMVTSANLLRANERLLRADRAKTALIGAYSGYAEALEEVLLAVLDLQAELRRTRARAGR